MSEHGTEDGMSTVEIGGQTMTIAQFDAARFPLLNPDPGPALSPEGAAADPNQQAIEPWSCPDCAFTFDAMHTDRDGGYSCPVCAEIRLERELADLREQVAAAHDVLREVADMWTGRDAFMPVAIIEKARRLLEAAAASSVPAPTDTTDEGAKA